MTQGSGRATVKPKRLYGWPALRHAVTHADSDVRAAAVLATLEADVAGQAPQLWEAVLSDMARLRGCA